MEDKFIKPKKLNYGDTVALITLSWGGASVFPDRYETGKKQFEDALGLKVIDTPNAKKPADWIYNNPHERLNDLLWAFKNPDIKGIITIIGGDDSIRLFDFVTEKHLKIIRTNPKIFIGFSDTTTINNLLLKAGLVSFYGPTILFGLAENGGIHEYTLNYLKKALFSSEPIGLLENNKEGWTIDRVPWLKEYQNHKRKLYNPLLQNFIQGQEVVEGKIIGGCMEIMEMLKGTEFFPSEEIWKDSILFLETSELKPSVDFFTLWLRNYGALGILGKLKGIIFGIPGGDLAFDDVNPASKLKEHIESFKGYDEALIKITKEYGRTDLPIVTHVQLGHISPMITIPIGTKVKIDPKNKKIEIIEAGVTN